MTTRKQIAMEQSVANYLGAITSGFHRYRADYRMSKETRFNRPRRGLATRGGSGDYHIRSEYDFYTDIERARDMDRNDAVVGQTIDRSVCNQIQDGFSLDIDTGDPALDSDLLARWKYETSDPELFDIAGEMDFHDAEQYVARAMLLDGDCGIAGVPYENKFQFFEAHNIYSDANQVGDSVSHIINGVEINATRRRIAYHIALDDINPYNTRKQDSHRLSTLDPSGVRQFFHVYNPKRVTMTRGKTSLAPIFEIAGILEDINFAKLVQQQAVSCFAVFRQRQLGAQAPPSVGGFASYGNGTTEAAGAGGMTQTIDNIAPGMEIIGDPGETLTGFSPEIPNSNYFEQVQLILRMIGVNLGMPLMMVLLDGSDSTFHGYRGALDEARRGFKANQRNIAKRFHRPAYVWKLNQWLLDDIALLHAATRPGLDIFNHKWCSPGFPYVEPVNDAQGDILQLSNMLTSPRRIQQARSRDHQEIVKETVDDNARAISAAAAKAAEINSANPGIAVTWRDLVAMPMPQGATMATSITELPEDADTEPDEETSDE